VTADAAAADGVAAVVVAVVVTHGHGVDWMSFRGLGGAPVRAMPHGSRMMR